MVVLELAADLQNFLLVVIKRLDLFRRAELLLNSLLRVQVFPFEITDGLASLLGESGVVLVGRCDCEAQ